MRKSFDREMENHQTEWRACHVTSTECGVQLGRRRPWILPERLWEKGLWPGIRSDSDNPLSKYLTEQRIQRHTGAHNLKSSWALCANLYFPFRATADGRGLLASFLKHHVDGEITSLEDIELEYAEEGELHPSQLLREEGGGRGTNQTSPDLGLKVNGCDGLVLVEVKFTEHSFYRCSARRHESNFDRDRCKNAAEVARNPKEQCHWETWEGRERKYWKHLKPAVDHDVMAGLASCPAMRHGYQLFRQQALAEGIANSGKYGLVVSAVAFDERNEYLEAALRRSGIAGFDGWGRLFKGKAKFAALTHQEWVRWVQEHQTNGEWDDWLRYVQDRYGFGMCQE